MSRECKNLLSFISEELEKSKKKTFAEHLKNCPECTREYDQMTEAWNSLKWDFEEVEPPASLQSEVMNFVFERNEKPMRKANKWGDFFNRQFTPVTTGLLLISLIFAIVLSYSTIHLKKELVALDLPVMVATTLYLKPTDNTTDNVNTDGAAYILQQGEERSLVVQIQNLPALHETEVYQVWLLSNGERANAGTFKPDKTGTGLLTYRLSPNDQFDQIGITKEPDPNGSQPRGKKIVGST